MRSLDDAGQDQRSDLGSGFSLVAMILYICAFAVGLEP